ncbi:MAG: CPBP family intramembrane metalloprotease [Holophagales bacterium]|nr:CPBP family intramembrane metalloprotease [Holophagales bacterium]
MIEPSDSAPLVSRARKLALGLELAVIFVGFPIGLVFVRSSFARWIVPTLLVTGAACLLVLWRDPSFDRRQLWNARHLRRGLVAILRIFVPAAALVGLLVALLRPELLFELPRSRTGIWVMVMLLYPLLSVYPQELIFRTFFFHRYRPLIGSEQGLVVASALVFGLAHLFFANWVAPVLTTAGGYLFARTYARSRSTLQAVLEHGLWGDFLFTIGLGWYFWGGSIRNMAGID